MSPPHHKTDDASAAKQELAALCKGFFKEVDWIASCEIISAEEMPDEARALLVHPNHMTATLNAHYGQPVALQVLESRWDGIHYRRKILLTIDAGRRVVEFGILRIDLGAISAEARNEVLNQQAPLGDILIRHGVFTRVEPRWYLHFRADSPVVQCFAAAPARDAYGRIGLIYCNGEPAVELLEVVPG